MITLRPYQIEAIDAIRLAAQRGIRRQLVSLPTGTGKTCCFSSIAQGAAAKRNRTLILAHRDELISQAVDKLVTVAPELEQRIGVVKAKRDEWDHPVVVASVQSLHRRRRDRILSALGPAPFRIITVDEAHHTAAASYQAILQDFGSYAENGVLTVGWTATPQRADNRDLGDTYEEVVYHRDLLSMIEAGYLCPLSAIEIRLQAFDTAKLRVRAGDYVDEQAGELLEAAEAPMHAARAWLANAAGRRTIVFTPTIRLAEEMAYAFQRAGVDAEMVSGQTPLDDRRDLLRRFQAGDITVVANAQVLTEGFDDPGVECIMIARPTKSAGLYQQMVGRGTRIYPGKTDCLIIDIVGAASEHSLQTAPKMFGLGEEGASAGEGDDEAKQTQRRDISEEALRRIRDGRITARQIELFDRGNLNWKMAGPGVWCLSLADETVVCDTDASAGTAADWRVTVYPKDAAPRRLAEGLDLTYAMGVAEEYARRAPALAQLIVSKAAGWRSKPPKPGQLKALTAFRIPLPDGATRGEVSDMLGIQIAMARRRREAS
jgi:superfamily II DNA or RNA helicase